MTQYLLSVHGPESMVHRTKDYGPRTDSEPRPRDHGPELWLHTSKFTPIAAA